MLGYKPFFKEYTTDWEYAVAKMKGSFFQRHLVEESFAVAKSWPEQVKLGSGEKPRNAEYEQWTGQLHQNVDRDDDVKAKARGGDVIANGHSRGDQVNGFVDGQLTSKEGVRLRQWSNT